MLAGPTCARAHAAFGHEVTQDRDSASNYAETTCGDFVRVGQCGLEGRISGAGQYKGDRGGNNGANWRLSAPARLAWQLAIDRAGMNRPRRNRWFSTTITAAMFREQNRGVRKPRDSRTICFGGVKDDELSLINDRRIFAWLCWRGVMPGGRSDHTADRQSHCRT